MSRSRLFAALWRGKPILSEQSGFCYLQTSTRLDSHRARTSISASNTEHSARERVPVQRLFGEPSTPHSPLVDEEDFARVASLYDAHDAAREVVIKASRDIIKGAKKAIYALHRGDYDLARKKLKAVDAAISDLKPVFQAHPRLREERDYLASLEELAEAECFRHFLETGSLLTFELMNDGRDRFSAEDYVGGVCDFTGELGRYAVHRAIARDFEAVVDAFHLLDGIHGQLLNFDFRNRSGAHGDLRFKFDQIKWTVRKVEQLVYDCSVQGGAGANLGGE